jgi:hypothetical protein
MFWSLLWKERNSPRHKYRVIHKSLRNFRTQPHNNQDRHSRKQHINSCKVGQQLGVSLPLLTCSPSAWPSRILYRRGRTSRRVLWITLYISEIREISNRITDFGYALILGSRPGWFRRRCAPLGLTIRGDAESGLEPTNTITLVLSNTTHVSIHYIKLFYKSNMFQMAIHKQLA